LFLLLLSFGNKITNLKKYKIMKKLTTRLVCLTLGAVLMGCNLVNDETFTKKLVGTFHLAERQIKLEIDLEVCVELMLEEYLEVEEISTDIYIEYTDSYLADNTLMKMGSIAISFLDKEDGFLDEAFDMNYHFSVTGTWRVENGKIIYTYNFNKLNVQYVDDNATSAVGEFLTMFYDEISESLIAGFEEHFLGLEADPPKIIKINDKELVLMIDDERIGFKKGAM